MESHHAGASNFTIRHAKAARGWPMGIRPPLLISSSSPSVTSHDSTPTTKISYAKHLSSQPQSSCKRFLSSLNPTLDDLHLFCYRRYRPAWSSRLGRDKTCRFGCLVPSHGRMAYRNDCAEASVADHDSSISIWTLLKRPTSRHRKYHRSISTSQKMSKRLRSVSCARLTGASYRLCS